VTSTSGQPVVGATVQAWETGNTYLVPAVLTTTDSEGGYSFSGLTQGSYQVCADGSQASGPSPSGYGLECYGGVAWPWQGSFPVTGATDVTVTGTAPFTGVDIQLPPESAVTGEVTAADAPARQPLAGVTVSAYEPTLLPQSYPVASIETRSDGTYRLTGLATGSYYVCFAASGATTPAPPRTGYVGQCWGGGSFFGGAVTQGATEVSVTVGALTPGIDVALSTGGEITGKVTADATNGPVDGAGVYVVPAGGGVFVLGPSTSTAADGSYQVTSLAPGAYDVCTAPSGQVGYNSSPYADECYEAFPWDGNTNRSDLAGATAVTVVAGSTAVADVTVYSAGSITGTVTDSSGNPLPGVEADVFTPGGATSAGGATTDASGEYTVSGLAAGTYWVCFDATGAKGASLTGYADQCFSDLPWDGTGGEIGSGTNVEVTNGAVTGDIDARMQAGGSVSGRVTDASSAPLGGVQVSLFGTSGEDYTVLALTAGDGTYSFNGVAAGAYDICFDGTTNTAAPAGYLRECYASGGSVPWGPPGSAPSAAATAVQLSAGQQVSDIDAGLSPAAGISGTVTTAAGSSAIPLSNAEIQVFTAPTAEVAGTSFSSDDGTYSVTGLSAGSYDVCFISDEFTQPAGNYVGQCYDQVAWTGRSGPPPTATAVTAAVGAVTGGVDAKLSIAGT
jgi:hypothetical protein